jgi:hypothetical protein
MQVRILLLWYCGVSGMYCSILITVSQEEDSILHMQGCQVCTVPFWSQYHKKRIPTYICRGVRYYCDQNGTVHTWHPWICKLESPSCDTVIRMEQYIPDTTDSDHSITRRGFQRTYAGVSGMYCSILITVSQEGDSNLHMQGCQCCTVPFWSQYMYVGILFLWYCDQNGTVHTWHPCICKLESSSCDTVIRIEQYIPDTPAYVI